LWIFPFISFVLGYSFTHCFFHKKVIAVPNLIGKPIHKAIKVATLAGLNIRLLREKEDVDLVEGIILEQTPRPHRKIKPNQYLFVTLSKQPQDIIVPCLVGQKQDVIVDRVKKLGIRSKTFWLDSKYPREFCVAQTPQPGTELRKQILVTYFSLGKNKLFVFPNMRGMLVSKVKEFLEREGIKVEVFHDKKVEKYHLCECCKVLDQKPMAGTIIDKKLYVQLQAG